LATTYHGSEFRRGCALLKALDWIKELGFQDVIFSHGSKTIIDDFNSSVNNFNIDNVSIPLLNASR
jgi:ribonuclease HI